MTQVEIKNHLSQFSNFIQLIQEANKLKAAGEKETSVNKVVMELKSSMAKKDSKINRLNRTVIDKTPIESVGTLGIAMDNLEQPIVMYDGSNIII